MNLILGQSHQPLKVQVEHRFEFGNVPEDWAAVLMLVIIAAAIWWVIRTYRREVRTGATLSRRMLLAGFRSLVFGLLAAIWLQPVIATYFHQHIESHTLVLVDASASMDIKDYYLDENEKEKIFSFLNSVMLEPSVNQPQERAKLAKLLLSNAHRDFLKGLVNRNQVKLFAFSDHAAEIASWPARRGNLDLQTGGQPFWKEGELDFELPAGGQTTDLGNTLRRSVDSLGGAPLAGVVVISDGGFNWGESIEVLGQYASSRNIPVHTIGVGDASLPRNVRISEFSAPANTFVKDPFLFTVKIESQGLDSELLELELTERLADSPGNSVLVTARTIAAGANGQTQALSFEHRNENPGRFAYRLSLKPQPGESVTADNTRQILVNVMDNKIKVLLVSGGASWSYRYLYRLLQRDETFDLSCWLQSADRTAVRDGNTVIDHLPETADELFAYDTIILLDPDPRGITRQWGQLIDQHISRHGAGMVLIAARKNSPRFFRTSDCQDLVKLLPVTPNPEADLILNQIGYFQKFSAQIEFPKSAWNHTLFADSRFVDQPELDLSTLWRQIARVFWHYPVKHEKPAATVLMRHGHPRMRNSYGGHVLLATQYVGAGRAAYLGFDGTWRWRRYGEEIYNQFWVRLLRDPGYPAGCWVARIAVAFKQTGIFTMSGTRCSLAPACWSAIMNHCCIQRLR